MTRDTKFPSPTGSPIASRATDAGILVRGDDGKMRPLESRQALDLWTLPYNSQDSDERIRKVISELALPDNSTRVWGALKQLENEIRHALVADYNATALTSAPVPDWQPIETAPKDKCIMLAHHSIGADPYVGWKRVTIKDGVTHWYTQNPDGNGDYEIPKFMRPTHWQEIMKMPVAPTEKQPEPVEVD